MAMNKVTSEDVNMFLSAVLVGLQRHGQHESIQSLLLSVALRIYELAVSSVAVSMPSSLATYMHRAHCFTSFQFVTKMHNVAVCTPQHFCNLLNVPSSLFSSCVRPAP